MSFFVEGDYFEVCNCDVSCNCVWLGAATQDNCDVLLAWHVTNGSKDGVDLSGLNAVMAVHSPKRMTDGGWKVALYLDDRASAEQSEALGAVFSGGAGGYLAGLGPLIGEVAGVEPAAITFEKSDGSLHAEVVGRSVDEQRPARGDGRPGAGRDHERAVRRCPAAGPAGQVERRELPRPLERRFLGHEQLRHRFPVRRLTRDSAMADHAGPASVTRPVQALPPRQLARPWIAVAALAAVAWAVTVMLARSMGNGPGTMGLALLPFLGLWVVMMAAMMLPSVAPVAVLWTRLISGASTGSGRVMRMSLFLGGYLLAWAAFGAVAFAALAGTGRLLTASPTAAKWLGVAIFITAGIYQLTPWKDWCLRRCRSPIGALMYYLGFKGRSRDVRVGLHHGATCAGCCWGLMILLIAVGVMNVAVMAALAVVIFAEKLWRHGKPFGQAVGVLLVAIGVLAIWFPWLLPGLHASAMPAM